MGGKISELTAASSVADVDQVELLQGGVNKRATVDLILDGVTATRINTALTYTAANDAALNATNLTSGTVPDARFPATLPAASGVNLTNLVATNIATGLVPTARLGGGTASSSTYLRGDQTWATVTAGVDGIRTFVKPYAAATNIGGGFFQANLFRLTLGSPDAASGQLVVHAKIIDVTTPKSGAFYYEVPICFQRDSLEVGGNIPSGLIRTHFDGSTGGGATSVGFFQGALAVSAPNIDISLVIQPVNFTSPAVSMSAVFIAPGDVPVTIL